MSNDLPPGGTTALSAPPDRGLPRPGPYQAAGIRCIFEISAALGPLATIRGRMTVLDNTLVVQDTADWAALSGQADVRSLRTTRPLAGRRLLGRRGLDAGHHGRLRWEADRIRITDRSSQRVDARLTVRGTELDITMTVRFTTCTSDRIALLATGEISGRILRDTCSVRLPRSVPADRVRLLLAADFR